MECKKIKKWSVQYLYEDLSSTRRAKFDEHLSSCLECSGMVKDYIKILGHVQKKEAVKPPLHLDSLIISKARQHTNSKKSFAYSRKRIKPLYPSWALAAALLGIIMVIIHVVPRHYSTNVPTISKRESQKPDTLQASRINTINLTPAANPTALKPERMGETVPVLVEAEEDNAEADQEVNPDDSYNKHPFAPYDDSEKIYQAPSGVDLASYQHQRGIELKNQGRCQDANNIFDRIIREHPGYRNIKYVYIDSADCYSRMGQKYDAVKKLQMYLKIYPQEDEVIKKLNEEIDK